ncbi:MAG: hypothetical protein LUD46_08270 [Parabacteroides sp.]|nr:hypothetical protein [Parabacteroides sp.]
MKQKYYSMTPDISASGTTINDVGKQTYSHKHFNLWSFLLCLMAMMLPVGAWGGKQEVEQKQILGQGISDIR